LKLNDVTTIHSVIIVFRKETASPVEEPWTGVGRGTLLLLSVHSFIHIRVNTSLDTATRYEK